MIRKEENNTREIVPESLVAILTSDFILPSMGWIYRQITSTSSKADLVLTFNRHIVEEFAFEPVYHHNNKNVFVEKLKGKFWTLAKYFSPKLSDKTKHYFIEILKKHQTKLLHVHFGTSAVLALKICKELQLPMIVTFHGFDITSAINRWPGYKKKLQEVFQYINYAIAISKDMEERLISLGCQPEKIKVSYLGVPVSEFEFIDRSDRENTVVFLHVGRLAEKKGVPDLVKAFSLAFPEKKSVMLNIVGDGEEMNMVKKAIQDYKPMNKVNILGWAKAEEVKTLLKEADVFVLNSRTDSKGTKEGLPISNLEAAATGLPIISTSHAGIPESIVDGETGVLVEEGNTIEFAKAMGRLFDQKIRIEMGKKARQLMENKFDVERCNKRLGDIYKEAIKVYSIDK